MASVEWTEPRLLIENADNTLRINEVVADELAKVDKPLVVVCIAGPYRTGKSYLMNRLAGKQSGFALGSTVESKTKGIWVWIVDHPLDCDKALLLMDTEGLDDVFKDDDTYDLWICCLALLLSSVFVYNIIGRIENSIIDRLHFITEISSHIKACSEDISDESFDEFLPSFILSVRDFFLKLEKDGKPITADEYMEQMLLTTTKPARNAQQEERLKIRLKLRTYFKERTCFCFQRPVGSSDKLNIVDSLQEHELEPDFVEQVDLFNVHIYTTAPVKKLYYIQEVNGRVFVHLARQYLNAIQEGKVPCVKSALDMVAEKENTKAVEDAVNFYCRSMNDLLAFPAEPIHLADTHQACHRQAVNMFLEKAFLDRENCYRDILQERLENEYNRIVLEDSTASWDKCQSILKDLFSFKIDVQMRLGTYIASGGYKKYTEDLEQVKFAYNSRPDKGIKSDEVLLTVLNEKINDQVAIMLSDEALTEAEQNSEDARIKEEAAMLQLQLQQQEMEELQRHQENLKESHNEHMKASYDALQRRLKEQEEEFQKVIQHRRAEQDKLAQQFEREATDLKVRIG